MDNTCQRLRLFSYFSIVGQTCEDNDIICQKLTAELVLLMCPFSDITFWGMKWDYNINSIRKIAKVHIYIQICRELGWKDSPSGISPIAFWLCCLAYILCLKFCSLTLSFFFQQQCCHSICSLLLSFESFTRILVACIQLFTMRAFLCLQLNTGFDKMGYAVCAYLKRQFKLAMSSGPISQSCIQLAWSSSEGNTGWSECMYGYKSILHFWHASRSSLQVEVNVMTSSL